jgi:hypothetical protein
LDPGRLPGFRRQAEAAAGLPDFGWPGSAHTVLNPRGRLRCSVRMLAGVPILLCSLGVRGPTPSSAVRWGPCGAAQLRCAGLLPALFAGRRRYKEDISRDGDYKKGICSPPSQLTLFVPSRTSVSDGGNECPKGISQKFVGKVFLRNS